MSNLPNVTLPPDMLDIEDALVTPENPAIEDDGLDYERCARLHNYIVMYGWMAQHDGAKPGPDDLKKFSWGPEHEDKFQQTRSRLHPSLNRFLDLVYEPIMPSGQEQFFFWVDGLSLQLSDEWMFELSDETRLEEDLERFVVLYITFVDLGSHTVGVLYDQKHHRVSFPLVQEYLDSVIPIDEHEEMWFPLETLLSHWIYLIKIGKMVCHEDDGEIPDEVRSYGADIGRWWLLSYCQQQVDDTVAAIDRYTALIESKMPPGSHLPLQDEPLFTDADLDAASVPENCFIRSVLTRIKTPRFKRIAPGLAVPHDKAAFIDQQPFTRTPYDQLEGKDVPAVLIFPSADPRRKTLFHEELRWHFFEHKDEVPFSGSDAIPAGLYSEAVRRNSHEQEEAGFRLVLPYPLRCDWKKQNRARRSDGSLVDAGSFADLFQNGGFYKFGGEHRSQRLERLIDKWTELVESGVWTVGKDGVDGNIDKFADADGESWRDYWIAPTW